MCQFPLSTDQELAEYTKVVSESTCFTVFLAQMLTQVILLDPAELYFLHIV